MVLPPAESGSAKREDGRNIVDPAVLCPFKDLLSSRFGVVISGVSFMFENPGLRVPAKRDTELGPEFPAPIAPPMRHAM